MEVWYLLDPHLNDMYGWIDFFMKFAGPMPHKWFEDQGHICFKYWLIAYWIPSHYLNQCCTVVNKTPQIEFNVLSKMLLELPSTRSMPSWCWTNNRETGDLRCTQLGGFFNLRLNQNANHVLDDGSLSSCRPPLSRSSQVWDFDRI